MCIINLINYKSSLDKSADERFLKDSVTTRLRSPAF